MPPAPQCSDDELEKALKLTADWMGSFAEYLPPQVRDELPAIRALLKELKARRQHSSEG